MSERETSVDSIAYVKIFPYVDKINIGLVLMYSGEAFSYCLLMKHLVG